jgi:hypothetical protein
VIVKGDELIVVDLKYGRGVRVDATENEQLQLYALGALESFGLAYEFERVRHVIVQPRLDAVSEWGCTVEELRAFAARAADAYALALSGQATHQPSGEACKFCKAKADCPALTKSVAETVIGDFEDISEQRIEAAIADLPAVFSLSLGRKMAMVDLVEQWCKAVRARVESELLAGRRVDGFKLVEGRRGHRQWADECTVEETLKSMRLRVDEMYDLKLISPATAEKRLKESPRRWAKVSGLITQSPGKPSVAPDTDKRAALNPADDFADLTATSNQHPFRP